MIKNESDYILLKKVNFKRDSIFLKLREKGFRITNQRKIIIDIILRKECTSCKEIFWEALKKDKSIGISTVYRIIKSLEEIGVINRKNFYKISTDQFDILRGEAIILLKNKKVLKLSEQEWKRIIMVGLYQEKRVNINDIEYLTIKKIYIKEKERII